MSKKLEEMLDPSVRPAGVRGPRLMKKGEKLQRHGRKQEKSPYAMEGLVLAAVIPMLILLLIFVQRGIFPFGERSFLRTDMYHQYAPFFSEFKHKLETGGSLFYSWDVGMGINFSALYAYYLASPLNWLLVFCPKSLVIEFMTYMIVLKTGLCGLSFAWYLKKHCKTENFGIAYFGIFYALSGYMAAYSWNIMWLDCIMLFPIIMLGLERLVGEGKGVLYCVSLGLAILSNYYISIMICIFMVLYFFCLLLLREKKGLKNAAWTFGKFALYSLIAGGLAAIVLLPEIYAMQMTASGDFSFPKSFTSYFSIFDMIARHMANVEVEIGLDHWPNIYCGTAVLLFFVLYLGCRQIRVREKAVYCFLLLFFFASFSMNIPNFIWHGFHYPNSLPCRQSFIYIALMLTLCFRAFQYLKEIPWKQIGWSFLGACAFVVLAEKLVQSEQFHFMVFYGALLYLSFYVGCLYLYKRTKTSKSIIAFMVLAMVAIEATLNMAITSITTTSRSSYVAQDANIEELIESVKPSDDFFRVEKKDRKTKNDGAWEHFPSVSLFSSMANADLSKFFKYLGCESSTNAYSITGSTPLVDMLFSVRYSLCEEIPEVPWVWGVASAEDMYLYENQYVLPLGFGVDTDFEQKWHYTLNNPVEVQNDLAAVYGVSPVLVELSGEELGGDYRAEVEEEGEYYAYITNKRVDDVTALIGDNTKSFSNVKRGYLLELGYCYERSSIVLDAPDSDQDVTAQIYRVDAQALGELYSAMSREGWHLTEWRDTYLAGKITARKERLLFTTIPYDKGWTVKVDGEEVEPRKVVDAFLGFEIPAGEHEITMEYRPQGFFQGVWLSTGSVLLLVILIAAGRILKPEPKEEASNPSKRQKRSNPKAAQEKKAEAMVGEKEAGAKKVEIKEKEAEAKKAEIEEKEAEAGEATDRPKLVKLQRKEIQVKEVWARENRKGND
ncbi:MAG: YfhO family protein [bacterium]|nr:YfhO family protein [bacterium]